MPGYPGFVPECPQGKYNNISFPDPPGGGGAPRHQPPRRGAPGGGGAAGGAAALAAADAPGFRFGPAAEGQVEAAGPEVSTGARGRYWFADGTYLTVDATIGVATIPGAPTAVGTGPTIGFGGLTAGLGF